MAAFTKNKNLVEKSDPAFDLEIKKTDGAYLFDANGKKHLDFLMGWSVGNLGWGNKELKKAITNFKGPDYVYPGFRYEPWNELAGLLASITPGKLKKCYRATGGSESVEIALQLAMAYTGRSRLLSIEDSYHGNTLGTLSIGASDNRKKIKDLLPGCLKLDLPLEDKAISKLETKLKRKDISAFIMEPILCNLGVHIPSENFMQAARELCTKYGTLFILDEVASGFGRTGKLFAMEHFNIEPDIFCLAKGITGGYAGLGATITTEKIAGKVKDDVSIYSTYGWHPLSTSVAIANARYFINHGNSLFKNVQKASQHFRNRLSQASFRKKGKMNIIGLAIAVDVSDAKYATQIQQNCQKKGLLFTTQEGKLIFFPPLNIDEKTIDHAMDILESCI